jgi:hypothetical protein
MDCSRHGEHELCAAHAVAQRGRSRGAASAVALLVAGGLALVAIALVAGGLGADGKERSSRIQQRDALLGGPPAPKEAAPPATALAGRHGAAVGSPAATQSLWEGFINMPEVDSREPVTLHKSTAAQEHSLLGKLQTLEGTIKKATGLMRGGISKAVQSLSAPLLQKSDGSRVQLGSPPVRVLFDKEKQSKTVQSFIESGHMKCCVRDNRDLEEEVYPKYFDDFPMDPVCIPGYRKDGDDCVACDANHWCPSKEDLVMECPANTWSPIATGEVDGCWCEAGFYGRDPSIATGPHCTPCPADKFCAGWQLRGQTGAEVGQNAPRTRLLALQHAMLNPYAEERESRRQPQSVTLVQEALIMSTLNDRRTRANTHTYTHKQEILRRWTALQRSLSWTASNFRTRRRSGQEKRTTAQTGPTLEGWRGR